MATNENKFITDFTPSNLMSGNYFDLTDVQYNGGSSLVNGSLSKWLLLNRTYMIKRCCIDYDGTPLSDYLNEQLVYEFCNLLHIDCAYYRAVTIKYFDTNLNRVIECPACLTKIFPGELIYFSVLRKLFRWDVGSDLLTDFTERFNINPQLNDLIFLDYIVEENDRHAHNFGIVDGRMSPIYDSGCCLFYDIPDELLSDDLINNISRHRSFGISQDKLLAFCLRNIYPEFSFEFNEESLKNHVDHALNKVTGYSTRRRDFIRKFLKVRISNVGQIYAQTR